MHTSLCKVMFWRVIARACHHTPITKLRSRKNHTLCTMYNVRIQRQHLMWCANHTTCSHSSLIQVIFCTPLFWKPSALWSVGNFVPNCGCSYFERIAKLCKSISIFFVGGGGGVIRKVHLLYSWHQNNRSILSILQMGGIFQLHLAKNCIIF